MLGFSIAKNCFLIPLCFQESTPGLTCAESLLIFGSLLANVSWGFHPLRPFPAVERTARLHLLSWAALLFFCSITLGGFGADRFYLGQWREGLGKLFSFGGLGIWTLIDVLLIGVGYVGPADGSLYI